MKASSVKLQSETAFGKGLLRAVGIFDLSLLSYVRFHGEVPPAVGPRFVLLGAERPDQAPVGLHVQEDTHYFK